MDEKTLLKELPRAVDAAMEVAQTLFPDPRKNTAEPIGGTRAPYGPGEQYAHKLLAETARSLDLEVEVDAAGNTYMTLPGRDRAAPRWFTGSHLDSVPQGGNYDGAAGVIAGVTALAALKRARFEPAQDLTVMGIRSEETGSWFTGKHGGHLGSRMALGLFEPDEFEQTVRVDCGKSLAQVMAECGFDIDKVHRGPPHLKASSIKGYLELHIEQGPVLEAKRLPVGVVTSIRGNARLRSARCIGEYNHGGGTPQELRRDAGTATSELVVEVDRAWQRLDAQGRDLVFAFGKFYTDPAAHTLSKVAGEVNFSLDLRSGDGAVLKVMRELVQAKAAEIGARRQVSFELGKFSNTDPCVLDESLRRDLAKGCEL